MRHTSLAILAGGCNSAIARVATCALIALASMPAFAKGPRDVADTPLDLCSRTPDSNEEVRVSQTMLAGVPALLRIPRTVTKPPIVLWHGFGPPASESALMAALPLDDVPAIKVYLGLPLFGARAPEGGNAELARLQQADFAMRLFRPAVVGAADELPSVVAALKRAGCMSRSDAIALFGFSAGGASALIALEQHHVPVRSVVVLNASTGLSASVAALERATHQPYSWTPQSRALAQRTDAVHRAAEIAHGSRPPALLIVQGAGDETLTDQPAIELHDALAPYYRGARSENRLKLDVIADVAHNWAADPSSAAMLGKRVAQWYLQN